MATDMYIKFDDIKGESSQSQHEEWSEIFAWRHQVHQPTPPSRVNDGSTTERAKHFPITINKRWDMSTIDILKYNWSGKQFEKVTIDCLKSAGDEPIVYLKIEMDDVIVCDYNVDASEGNVPIETIGLDYSKITYTYNPKNKDDAMAIGQMPVSADLKTNVIE
jgi:type VI secretion system secreted protein Hcp